MFLDCLNRILRAGGKEATMVEWKEWRKNRLIRTNRKNEHKPHGNPLQFFLQLGEQFDHRAFDNSVTCGLCLRGRAGQTHKYGFQRTFSRLCTSDENCLVCSICLPHEAPKPVTRRGTLNAPANGKPNFDSRFLLVARQEEATKNSRLQCFAFGKDSGEGLVTPEDLVLAQRPAQ
jgi:hypothetical protein